MPTPRNMGTDPVRKHCVPMMARCRLRHMVPYTDHAGWPGYGGGGLVRGVTAPNCSENDATFTNSELMASRYADRDATWVADQAASPHCSTCGRCGRRRRGAEIGAESAEGHPRCEHLDAVFSCRGSNSDRARRAPVRRPFFRPQAPALMQSVDRLFLLSSGNVMLPSCQPVLDQNLFSISDFMLRRSSTFFME